MAIQIDDLRVVTDLNTWERELKADLVEHPALKRLRDPNQMDRDQLFQLLLQRKFFSFHFTEVADLVETGLRKKANREVVRDLIREEYPATDVGESHRILLREDMKILGISHDDFANVVKTPETAECLERTYDLLRTDGDNESFYEVRLLAAMRSWGEVLVAVEYSHFASRLSMEGLTKENSEFYLEHVRHDAPRYEFGENGIGDSKSHSDKLAARLQEEFSYGDSSRLIAHCARIEQEVTAIKKSFYNQFKT